MRLVNRILLVKFFSPYTTGSGRVRVAVRLRPKNAEDIISDSDFSNCVELQPEVIGHEVKFFFKIMKRTSLFYYG